MKMRKGVVSDGRKLFHADICSEEIMFMRMMVWGGMRGGGEVWKWAGE